MTSSPDEPALEAAVRAYAFRPLPGANRSDAYNEARAKWRLWEENDQALTRIGDRLARVRQPPARVVEVGSGTGGLSVALARRGYETIGIEPEQAGIGAAELRAARYPEIRCRFVVGVAEALPLESASVSAVVSNQVVEHLPDPDGAAREMFRVLEPGGVLIHAMPNYAFPYEPHYRIPWPPRASRELGRAYLRIIGRDTRMFDDSIFPTTNSSVIGLFKKYGFVGVHNRYESEVEQKLHGEGIRSAKLRTAVGIAQRTGVLPLLRRAIMRWELYPAIVLMAWKPPLPAEAEVYERPSERR